MYLLSISSCSFEEMLRAADDEEGLLSRAAGGLANGAGGSASGVVKTLLRRPRIFILGVVWETPQVWSPPQHPSLVRCHLCMPPWKLMPSWASHRETKHLVHRTTSITAVALKYTQLNSVSGLGCRRRTTPSRARWRRCAPRWTLAVCSRGCRPARPTACGASAACPRLADSSVCFA